MTSTIPAVMDPTWWTAMSSCGSALGGQPDGWRLGLGVLQQRGVAAWLRLRQATVPTTSPPPPARAALPIGAAVEAELVGLLASMALAVAARR
jgi:hypothetical protein